MHNSRWRHAFALMAMIIGGLPSSIHALGQGPGESAGAAVLAAPGFDAQLYVVIASNEGPRRAELPRVLDSTIRQLKETVPFNSYSLGATFIGTIKDKGFLEQSGVASPNMVGQYGTSKPVYYEFSLGGIRLDPSGDAQQRMSFDSFRFGLRIPLADPNNPGNPVFTYQPIGFKTSMNLREGVPAVVGTMAVAQPDEQLVLILLIRRTAQR